MLTNSDFYENMRVEALLFACHILNRNLQKDLHATPEENINIVWECICLVHVRLPDQHTLQVSYLRIVIYLLVVLNCKVHRFSYLETLSPHIIVESIHPNFFKKLFFLMRDWYLKQELICQIFWTKNYPPNKFEPRRNFRVIIPKSFEPNFCTLMVEKDLESSVKLCLIMMYQFLVKLLKSRCIQSSNHT